jgi:carbon monoxide dehydrogenase subunit G
MQPIATFELDVECSIETAFQFLSNMENFGTWFPEVISIVAKDKVPHRKVGKVYLEQVKVPLKGEVSIPIAVANCQPNTMFQTQGAYPPVLPQMTVKLHSKSDTVTHIHWTMVSRNNGLLFRFTLLPLVRAMMRKRARLAKENLNTHLQQLALARANS